MLQEVIFMARNPVLKSFVPACKYCKKARLTADGEVILCERHGSVLPDDSCRRFKYDPLKRQPGQMSELPEFTPDQFVL